MIVQGKARRPVDRVMLHTLAVPTDWYTRFDCVEDITDEVRRWHVKRGWRDIGYHRVFDPHGDMAEGRSLYEIGAGCAGENRGVIHLAMCNVNEVTRIGEFDEFYARETRVAVRDYLLELEELHGEPLTVVGHNDYANKLCPGFEVVSDEWL